MQSWLFLLMVVGNESGKQMDNNIDGARMTGMLDVRNVLEIVDHRFDTGSFVRASVYTKGAQANFSCFLRSLMMS